MSQEYRPVGRYAVRLEGEAEAEAVLLRPANLVDMALLMPLLTAGTARHLLRQLEQATVKAGVAPEDAPRLLELWRAAVVSSDPTECDRPGENDGAYEDVAMF